MLVSEYFNHLKAIQNISALPRDLCDIITKYTIDNNKINTCLIYSSGHGLLESVKYLLNHGADPTTMSNFAVIAASENGHLEVVKYLVEHGTDITDQDNLAVLSATKNGHIEVVKYLHKAGADITTHNNLPHYIATNDRYLDIKNYLEANGATIYDRNVPTDILLGYYYILIWHDIFILDMF